VLVWFTKLAERKFSKGRHTAAAKEV